MTIEFSAPPAPAPPPEAAPSEDSTRYERLFTTHYLPVMRVCLRRLQDQSDAEDAVQEVFRRAVQQGADLEGDPLPWLVTVAKHVCLDEIRRRRTGRVALERTAAYTASAERADSDIDRNPERVVVGHMFVRDLLGRLTPAERRVMAARLFSGESGVETAQSLGVSSSTTRVLLARARQKLRTYLEEGQAVLGGAALFTTRTVYGLRRRIMEPSQLHDRAMALFPAALILTAVVAPGATLTRLGHDDSAVTAQAPDASLHDGYDLVLTAGLGRAGHLVGTGGTEIPGVAGGGGFDGVGPRSSAPVLQQLAPADPQAVDVTDVEPSPDYSSDNTVWFIGNLRNCSAACAQLFRSTDDGVHWSRVDAAGLSSGGQLILPANAYQHGRFYAFTNSGLEMTRDGGQTFVPLLPGTMATGYATAAPGWSGFDVTVSNAATVWKVTSSLTPLPLTTVGVDHLARGAALLLPSVAGDLDVLQPVVSASSLSDDSVYLLHCGIQSCEHSVRLPFTAPTNLVPSPSVLTDRTVFAWSGGSDTLAISRDGAETFSLVSSDTIAHLTRLTAVAGPSGPRLVGALYPRSGAPQIVYSDDLGASWQRSWVDPALALAGVKYVAGVAPGRMIASALQSGRGAYYGFACSADAGATWRACTPQSAG